MHASMVTLARKVVGHGIAVYGRSSFTSDNSRCLYLVHTFDQSSISTRLGT